MASILIDGSVLEGGGQILRNTIALSALLSKDVSLHNIRANRRPPGLKRQHAAGLKLVADICSAKLTGLELGSTAVDFKPGPLPPSGIYSADPGTAGSTTLLLQASLPCLLFSARTPHVPHALTLRGGTNADLAPQIDYTQHILLPFLRRHYNIDVSLAIKMRGYHPKGGGELFLSVPPVQQALPCVVLTERGAVKSVKGRAYVARLPASLAEAMSTAATSALVASGVDPSLISISAVREKDRDAVGSGSGIVLWAETVNGCILGGSALGRKRRAPEQVGRDAAEELARNLAHDGCVDEYLQDQIIIFLALAEGESIVRTGPLTLHTRTAIWVAEQLTEAKFDVEQEEGGTVATIRCRGIGLRPSIA